MLASFTPAGIDIEQYAQRVHKVSDRYIRSDEQTEPYQGDMTWGLLLHWSAKRKLFLSGWKTLTLTFVNSV